MTLTKKQKGSGGVLIGCFLVAALCSIYEVGNMVMGFWLGIIALGVAELIRDWE